MPEFISDIRPDGAICLGRRVVCDGFVRDYPFRVQTHIHDDHMSGFDTSKGFQDLFMTQGTYDLLVAERNADLPFRDNFRWIPTDEEYELGDNLQLSLLPSNHMLGGCQVFLKLSDEIRIGYSSDFGWPVNKIIQVDELVVDSTYGNPRSIRHYTQGEAEDCLLTLVSQRLRQGPVHIKAYRGTIERVLHVLGGNVGVPILASKRLIQEVEVYQNYGFAVGTLYALESEQGQHAMKHRSYIRLYSKGDGFPNEPTAKTSITCSAYRLANATHPLLIHSDKSYQVALSNHADFHETLAYIEATGAKRVITDNTRNHGWDLAMAINSRLAGVYAEPRPV